MGVQFACPLCRAPLARVSEDLFRCEVDGEEFVRHNGIWHFLPAERAQYYERFVQEYEAVRRAEGRGSPDPEYYRALPFADRSGRFTEDWRIRAVSFRALVRDVVAPLEARLTGPLVVLDLGAGNGWLTNRLAERGHDVLAVDLQTNSDDGLGAHRNYTNRFTPLQAEFDRLPLAAAQVDLVVFNGSLHYSTDIARTLSEALRVLRPGGLLVVMDTPVYHDAASGEAMVREREEHFTRRYGFPSNALAMEGFLTYARVRQLGERLKLRWRMIEPFYGLRWALRPLRARLRGSREPARFLLLVGERREDELQLVDTRTLPRRLWRAGLRLGAPLRQRRAERTVLERVAGQELLVLPQVFNPRLLRSGAFFAASLDDGLVPTGASVLDLGTGSGIAAIAAARRARRVLAVDINPEAVRCARINALLNRADVVEVRQGDLFEPVGNERFDLILFNPPYYRGRPSSLIDHAWRSADVVERFAVELRRHLTPNGCALVILSTDGETQAFHDAFRANGLRIEVAGRRDLINEVLTIYRLSDGGRAA